MKKANLIVWTITAVWVIVAVALCMFGNYSNNFESMRRLYFKSGGGVVKSQSLSFPEKGLSLEVCAAGFGNVKPEYSVKITPTQGKNFAYFADGERFEFMYAGDLTEAFGVKEKGTTVTLETKTVEEVLSAYHGGAEITELPETVERADYFTLTVIGKDGASASLNLNYYVEGQGIELNPPHIGV